jgi:hypothetical protein
MSKETKIFGLQPQKIALFLTIGAESPSESQKAELLKYRLSKVILQDSTMVENMTEVTAQLFDIMGSVVGDSVQEILLDKHADLELLKKIKKDGKKLIRSAKTPNQREVGWVIYYAAISNPAAFGRPGISKMPAEELMKATYSLRKKTWIPAEIRKLFKLACLRCAQKRKQDS